MENNAKKESYRILPKVEYFHYTSSLEDLSKDLGNYNISLQKENPHLYSWMQEQINKCSELDKELTLSTIYVMHRMIKKASKSSRLLAITEKTMETVLSEAPKLTKGYNEYVVTNIQRIMDENPVVAHFFLELIKNKGSKAKVVAKVFETGVILYRLLEVQTLNTQ